jgi:HSP20 family protein
MALIRFNPVQELLSVERDFSRLFNEFESRFGFPARHKVDEDLANAVWTPMADIYEDGNGYQLKLDLPGMKKEDVKISFQDGLLKVSGERAQEKEEENGKYHRVERVYGKFFRSFNLPKEIEVDNINAEFQNGQLTITIPKAEASKPKVLEIKVK